MQRAKEPPCELSKHLILIYGAGLNFLLIWVKYHPYLIGTSLSYPIVLRKIIPL